MAGGAFDMSLHRHGKFVEGSFIELSVMMKNFHLFFVLVHIFLIIELYLFDTAFACSLF